VSTPNGRGLMIAMIDVEPEWEEEFNRWYDEEHFPDRVNCPGFLSGRRFVAVDGSPKYLAVYELESPEVMQSEAYKKISQQSPWTKRIHEHLTRVKRNVYVEITPKPKTAKAE